MLLFFFLTRGLQFDKFGEVLLAHAAEACFLDAQVFEFAFEAEIGRGLDYLSFVMGVKFVVFVTRDTHEAGDDAGNAVERPVDVGERLDEELFARISG